MARSRGTLLIVAAAILLSGCSPAVGVVDPQRVLNESVKALQSQKQLDDRAREMSAELDALAPQLSKDDLGTRRAQLQKELAQKKTDLERQLNQEMAKVVGQVARKDRLRYVIAKGPTLLGGRDITQQIIDRMK